MFVIIKSDSKTNTVLHTCVSLTMILNYIHIQNIGCGNISHSHEIDEIFERYYLPINALFWGYYALIVLLWEAQFPSDSEGTMYFPKQHYESIVPEKSDIHRLSASHDNNSIPA